MQMIKSFPASMHLFTKNVKRNNIFSSRATSFVADFEVIRLTTCSIRCLAEHFLTLFTKQKLHSPSQYPKHRKKGFYNFHQDTCVSESYHDIIVDDLEKHHYKKRSSHEHSLSSKLFHSIYCITCLPGNGPDKPSARSTYHGKK